MDLGSLGGSSSPPAVRRPVHAVQFAGSGGGGLGGGLGAVASVAGSALGGGGGSSDPWQEALVSVVVECGLAPAVDMVQMYLASGERAPVVAVGDSGSVSLGYDDSSPQAVFSGRVDAVQHSIGGQLRVIAADGGADLSRLRVNQSYEQQTAGDIVRDLAGRAGVDTDTVEDGVSLAFYIVDDGRSAFRHIAGLARKSGFLACFTPEGKLKFGPLAAGQAVQTFTYGQDILSVELTEAVPALGAVTAIGEGAAGSQGQDAWSWLVKDPAAVTASAGEGEPQRTEPDASLRSAQAAQDAAQGASAVSALGNLAGRMLVPGAPAVVVGSTIEIAAAPQDILNGSFVVRWVRHRFSKGAGFTTEIGFGQGSAGGSGGLL